MAFPWPRHEDPRLGLRRAFGTKLSFFPTCQGARSRHAEQFARGEFALVAGHRAEDTGLIKPGREEPWTPFRLIQLSSRGRACRAFGFYPTGSKAPPRSSRAAARASSSATSRRWRQYANNLPSSCMARAGADHHRRRPDRKLARLPRCDGLEHLGQRRPLVHQCQRHRGAEVWGGNRRRARAEARPDRPRRRTTTPRPA